PAVEGAARNLFHPDPRPHRRRLRAGAHGGGGSGVPGLPGEAVPSDGRGGGGRTPPRRRSRGHRAVRRARPVRAALGRAPAHRDGRRPADQGRRRRRAATPRGERAARGDGEGAAGPGGHQAYGPAQPPGKGPDDGEGARPQHRRAEADLALRGRQDHDPRPPPVDQEVVGPSCRMIPAMTGSALPTRPLGRSGLAITRVGFGAWAAGGGGWSFGWGPQDDEDSLAAMRRAIERGVNWIDTAAVYGLGHSEEVIGRFLRELPSASRPLVFTKCGLIWDEKNPMVQSRRVLQPESIARECEASLRRLGVERIDLYQFHWPDQTGTAVEDSWAAMARLVEQGKVRAAGVSNFGLELLERCEAVRHVDSLQPPFSLVRRGAALSEIPWCVAH